MYRLGVSVIYVGEIVFKVLVEAFVIGVHNGVDVVVMPGYHNNGRFCWWRG